MSSLVKGEVAPRLTRAEAKAETRRRLLEAAEAAFRRDGYHGASLERITAEAGFTTGAIYSTFESKAGVMMALVAARAERRRAAWTEALAATASAEDFVTEVSRQAAQEGAAERDWWATVIEFMTVVARDEQLRADYAEIHEESLAAFADSIRTWTQREGDHFAISPERLSIIVNALGRGLGVEALVAPDSVPEDLIVEAALTLLRGAQAGGEPEAGG
ncbi:MAG: TetR/AcrR family transcriptional regulator [Solirubrobacterales bacterium]